MQLSTNFTLYELTKSNIADEEGIDNSLCPEKDKAKIANLEALALHILQVARDHYGQPITPSSAYRCPKLNHHPRMQGSAVSQHMNGEAVDFSVSGVSNVHLAHWIAASLTFDQLILEQYDVKTGTAKWVHVSFRRDGRNRGVVNTMGERIYAPGLPALPVSGKQVTEGDSHV